MAYEKYALLIEQVERLPNGTEIKVAVENAGVFVRLSPTQARELLCNESPAWELTIRVDEGPYGRPVLDVWLTAQKDNTEVRDGGGQVKEIQ